MFVCVRHGEAGEGSCLHCLADEGKCAHGFPKHVEAPTLEEAAALVCPTCFAVRVAQMNELRARLGKSNAAYCESLRTREERARASADHRLLVIGDLTRKLDRARRALLSIRAWDMLNPPNPEQLADANWLKTIVEEGLDQT